MSQVELKMPKMGESVAEATITKWLKKEGDRVEQDEPILEIATDKVDSEVPSTAAGILVKQLYNEGDVVAVGAGVADGDLFPPPVDHRRHGEPGRGPADERAGAHWVRGDFHGLAAVGGAGPAVPEGGGVGGGVACPVGARASHSGSPVVARHRADGGAGGGWRRGPDAEPLGAKDARRGVRATGGAGDRALSAGGAARRARVERDRRGAGRRPAANHARWKGPADRQRRIPALRPQEEAEYRHRRGRDLALSVDPPHPARRRHRHHARP